MLSYQHAYHAGNLADVHKHGILSWILAYMTEKPKPLSYLETHAGRAVYDLSASAAQKTGEAAQGIARLESRLSPDHPYRTTLDACRDTHGADSYPGSPWIANHLLRADDTLHLAELHPAEHAALSGALPGAHCLHEDGLAMALSRTPPTPRRGLLLCDPSYEVKTEYATIPDFFTKLHRRWPVGVLVLWYPILTSGAHKPMTAALRRALPDGWLHEVSFPPAREGHGMVGSGLFVINPPYGLVEAAGRIGHLFDNL